MSNGRFRRPAIRTSGSDEPGVNAVARLAVRTARERSAAGLAREVPTP